MDGLKPNIVSLIIYTNTLIKKNMYIYSVLPVVFILYSYYYEKIVISDVWNHLLTYFIGGSVFSQYFLKDVIYNICISSYNYIKNIERTIFHDKYRELFDDFIKNNVVSKDYQCYINYLLSRYTAKDGIGYIYTDKDNEYVCKFLDIMVDMINNENVKECIVDDDILELVEKLEKFISDYPDIKDPLNYEIINPILLMLLRDKDKFGPPVSPVLLSGKPGTGKTRFAKKLAEILDAKLVEYHYDDRHDGCVNFRADVDSQYKKFNPVTKLILAKNKYKILLIDEMGEKLKTNDEMIGVLLKMLGSVNDKSIRDGYLDLNIRIPNNIIIICTSNDTLDDLCNIDKKFNSLKSRFIEIKIPDVPKDIQLKVVTEHMSNMYQNIDDSDKIFIKNIIDNTDYSGLRELLNMTTTYVQYLNSIESLKLYRKFLPKDEYQKKILDGFKLKN
jgi:hypothetical protein